MLQSLILKHRHLLTRSGNIRLRYVAAFCLLCTAFLIWGLSNNDTHPSQAVAMVSQEDTAEQILSEPIETTKSAINSLIPSFSDDPEQPGRGIGPYLKRVGLRPYTDTPVTWTSLITVKSGDTLGQLIEQTGLKGDVYFNAMKAIKQHLDPRDIKPGHTITVTYKRTGDQNALEDISYHLDSLRKIVLIRDSSGTINATLSERPVEIKTHATRTRIENSLFADLGKNGVPDGIISKMLKAYSWTVDFQRDIWGGEEVELLYETKETEDGSYVRSNRLLFANLILRDKQMPIYLFEKKDGTENYYEPNGESIRRALLRTPVDGARLSSGFGPRKHPVLGYNKMHKGLDFAAPRGTPIYAAGDGVIERANRFGAYGNYVRIRHNDQYKTAYAHMKGFGKGIRSGVRVKQGQVIGYVGTTGRSTGPHLHYEVLVNGQQVNPQSVDLPIGDKLKGTEMANFKNVLESIRTQYAALTKHLPKLAYASASANDGDNMPIHLRALIQKPN